MGIGLESAAHRWGALQARAQLPEVQAIIRREIALGTIRVATAPGGGIRIIPTDGGMIEEPEPAAGAVHEHGQTHSEPALRIRRTTS
jgi:hypothetical protein